jgi:hypothetical protein
MRKYRRNPSPQAAGRLHTKKGSARSPDEPAVTRMRGRWRHPGAVPHIAALMRATGKLAELAVGKKKRSILSNAIALRQAGRGSRLRRGDVIFMISI